MLFAIFAGGYDAGKELEALDLAAATMSDWHADAFMSAAVVLSDLRAGRIAEVQRICHRCPQRDLWLFTDGPCRMVVRIGPTNCILAIELLSQVPPNHIAFVAQATARAATGNQRPMT